MKIAVIGGGHGCYAAAVELSEKGHEVRLWRRDAAALQAVTTAGSIAVKDFRGERDVPIARTTTSLEEAIDGAQLVLIPLPATTHDDLSQQLAPLLQDGQVVFLPPGTFGSYLFAKAMRESGNHNNTVFAETGTLPYLARKRAPRQVICSGYATRLPTGVFPAEKSEGTYRVLKAAYPSVEPCEDALSGALMNAGPIIHPPLILMNAGPLEHFDSWDIHNEGTQPSIRRVTDALDQERIRIREALGYSAPHFPLRDHYNGPGAGDEWMYGYSAHEKLVDSGDWREDIDLQKHRYMVEDVALGMSFIVSVGKWAGVETPIATGMLSIGSAILERDLYVEGRTLENLGLADLSREQMHTLLHKRFLLMEAVIGVVGAGRMGRGIALSYAYSGQRVALIDLKARSTSEWQQMVVVGKAELRADLNFLASVNLLNEGEVERILNLISDHHRGDASTVLEQCPIIYEGVPEVMSAKEAVLAFVSEVVPNDTVIASTTSTFLVTELAKFVRSPERFMNAHWLNPAHLMPLVEISKSEQTSTEAVTQLRTSLEAIGKKTVVCNASPGYIVPRIQALAMNEAARLLEEGVASAEDIDRAIHYGFGPRFAILGLLEFIDWGGGDILYHASNYLSKAVDARYQAPEIVVENMQQGRNGLRDGVGFFDYSEVDTGAYRKRRLGEFVALMKHLDLLPKRPASEADEPRSA